MKKKKKKKKTYQSPNDVSNTLFGLMRDGHAVVAQSLWLWVVVVVLVTAMVTVEGDSDGDGSDGGSDGGGALLGHYCHQSSYMYMSK